MLPESKSEPRYNMSGNLPNPESSSRIATLEKELTQSRQRVVQAEKERTEYLQNVSHQLVAPLNAIKWHIENLTEGRLSIDRAKKVLRSVYSQATIAVHLAKNFNLMSNLEGDHALEALKEPLQEVQLFRLLVNLADDFQPLAWDRQIQIGVEPQHFETTPPVLAMKPLISQVFSNIIENAVKYSNSNTHIIIRGKRGQNDTISVQISNQGISLPSGQAASVFERGFRSEEAKRKYPAGTGFGLYIARRIVEIHEGSISAFNDPPWVVFQVNLSVRGLEGKARFRA
jgi:signal transduction histidine kinase